MSSVLYKDGESIRVPYSRYQAHIAAGWRPSPEAPKVDAKEDSADLQAAREMYEEKFGKKPHHKKTLETILNDLGVSDD